MEWRKNRVAIGAVAFFVLLGVTIWAISNRNRQPAADSPQIPTIEIEKDAITGLEITRLKSEAIVLSKVGEEWRVTVPLDAEADPNNIESALNRLVDLNITRIVATKPENYPRLEVDDAQAVQVVVKAGEETLTHLWIGKYSDGVTMLRLEDRSEVFGVGGSLRYPFDRDLKAWRNRKIVDVKSEDVQSITFASDKGTFQFSRGEDDWIPVGGEKKLKSFDPKKVTGLVSTASRLTASNFASEEISPARAGLNEPQATVMMNVAVETEGEPEDAAAPRQEAIMLELGGNTDKDTELYLRRKGNPTIYVISKYLADRLHPDATAFEKSEEAPPPPATPAPAPGQQQPQLPPEVMKQLQEQIRAQQQGR